MKSYEPVNLLTTEWQFESMSKVKSLAFHNTPSHAMAVRMVDLRRLTEKGHLETRMLKQCEAANSSGYSFETTPPQAEF